MTPISLVPRNRFLSLSVSLLLFGTLATGAPARADGLFLNGVSPRSIGRAGTNMGFADNGGVIFDNPAAMTNVEGRGLTDVGVNVMITDFEYSDPQNPLATDSRVSPLPQVAVIRKSEDGHWAYGFGVFMPAGFSQSYELQGLPPFAGVRSYESLGALVKILPAVAYKPTDRLSIGATVGAAISHVALEGPYTLQSVGAPTVMKLDATGAALVWSTGLQYELTDRTTLGLAYQSESRVELDGSTDVTVFPLGYAEYDVDARIKWPSSLAAGVKHDLSDSHCISADVIWFNWADSFDAIDIGLSSPTPAAFPALNERLPLNWRDTLSTRLGYEIDLDAERTLRFGYVYHRNPIPAGTQTSFIQAITEHGLSCGYGFHMFGGEIDLAYMFTIGEDQRVATSGLLGGDFSDSVHRAQTHAIGVNYIRRF